MATLNKGKTFRDGELVTPGSLHSLVEAATVINIVNADISASAAIADTKLAQITTANKVAQSAVTNLTSELAGKQPLGSYAPATGIAPSAITGTAVITNDFRLSDARTPTTHTHQASDITAGTLANARTTATSANTANTIVARDSGGAISAQKGSFGTINGFRVGVNENDTFPNSFMVFWGDNYQAAGSIVKGTGNSVSYNTSSDYRLKTNIEPLTDAVARLLQIPVRRFNWLTDPAASKIDGFLAHEAQSVVPESVTGTKDEVDSDGKPIYQGIDQSKLVPLLVAAVQELAARVASLESL